MGVVLEMHLGIQELENVLASRHGHLQVIPAETQVADGFKKTLDVEDKGDQAPSAEVAREHHGTTTDDDERNAYHAQKLNTWQQRSGEPRGRQVGHEMGSVETLKALQIGLFTAEALN